MSSKCTYCKGCAYLFVLQTRKTGNISAQCLAEAEYIDSPLRKRVSVRNLRYALKKNIHSDCADKKLFSFKAWRMKKWIISNLGGENVRQVGIRKIGTEYEKRYTEIGAKQGKSSGRTGFGTRNKEEKKITEKSTRPGKPTKKSKG